MAKTLLLMADCPHHIPLYLEDGLEITTCIRKAFLCLHQDGNLSVELLNDRDLGQSLVELLNDRDLEFI
jgi:hypothetical protein